MLRTTRDLFLATQTLATGLDPPFSPSICPFCFALFVQTIQPPERIAQLLQPEGHSFWTAAMAFLCADWTPERQDSVAKRLLRTALACGRCAHSGTPPSLFDFVFGRVRSCVHAALANLIDRYKGFGRKPRRWPTTAEQLFPYGPYRSVSALVERIDAHPNLQAILIRLLLHHRPVVFPPLIDNRTRLIDCFVHDFDTFIDGVGEALLKLKPPILPAVWSALLRKYYDSWQGAFALLISVTKGVDSGDIDLAQFCRGHEVRLFLCLHGVASLLDGEGSIKESRIVGHFASQLWVSLPESERARLECAAPPSYAREVQTTEAMEDPYRALRYCLSHRPRHRDCCAPGCTQTVHSPDAPPRGFARCARCRVVQYCSRKCQRAAWTAAAFPHREVCDALHELLTFVPSLDSDGMSADEFSAACGARAFPLERVDALIAWATRGKTCTNYAGHAKSAQQLFLPVERLADEGVAVTPESALFLVSFPTEYEGRKITGDELHAGLCEFKKEMQAEGLPISWRFL